MDKESRILIVDDEPANVRLLERMLQMVGYTHLSCTTDAAKALEIFDELKPDLVLTDLLMPQIDGLGVLAHVKGARPAEEYSPVIVLTADVNPESRKKALAAGANDFLTKPFDHSEVILRIKNQLQTRRLHLQLANQNATLEQEVQKRTAELNIALEQLKAAQQQTIQHERLRALAVMAGGVAHDFNNALTSILGYSELLLRDPAQGGDAAKVKTYLQTIMVAAKDGSKMVDRLRDFSRPPEENHQAQSLDLNELVEQTIALTLPKWKTQALAKGRSINITTKLAEVQPIAGNPAELREVLTNLIFNSVDAMPAGGTITIATSCKESRVSLAISDTGIGMTDEVRHSCLEPFFTTKGTEGTGLGLALVYAIVQRHSASIEIKSEPSKGSAFTLSFPAAPPATADSAVASPETLDRPLDILLVDDQPILCELLKEYLSADWHRVDVTSNPVAALDQFRSKKYDLVITDKAMPAMDGEQLAASMRKIHPKQNIILLTGFSDMVQTGDETAKLVNFVLPKPVSLTALRGAIAQVAD